MPGSTPQSGHTAASGTYYNQNHATANSYSFIAHSYSNPATTAGTRSFVYAVQTPQSFIRVSANNWESTPISTGLGNDSKAPLAATNGAAVDISVKVKSIFDPSPLGFRTPVNGTWDRFNDDGISVSSAIFPWTTNSRTYRDGVNAFYPSIGLGVYSSGLIYEMGSRGSSKSASPSSSANSLFLYFYETVLNPSNDNFRAYSDPIRPIQE